MRFVKMAQWLSRKLTSGPEYMAIYNNIWQYNDEWESWASTDEDHWWDKPEAGRLTEIANLWEHDPAAAFNGYKELAGAGSTFAMIWLGHCYKHGHGTSANFEKASDSYDRAMNAGSWIAALDKAALLFENGHFDECEACLKEGIECNFIPAFYWLAWYRIQRSPTRDTYDAARLLLTHATDEGHPQAHGFLAVSMMLGKFGWREIPRGVMMTRTEIKEFRERRAEKEKPTLKVEASAEGFNP